MFINTSINMNKILDEMQPVQLEKLIEEAQKRLDKKDPSPMITALDNYRKWGHIKTVKYIRDNSQYTLTEALKIAKDIKRLLDISEPKFFQE